jgi:uncharacterized protein (TIGR02391 family)
MQMKFLLPLLLAAGLAGNAEEHHCLKPFIVRISENWSTLNRTAGPNNFSNCLIVMPDGRLHLELRRQEFFDGRIPAMLTAVPESEDVAGIKSLHPEIYSRCRKLYVGGDYAEAVEKGFKVVRDRLRSLTSYETGSEAFGKGNLYVEGAAAAHVDDDFQNGVKFLSMAIDRFRNEKSHTADGNISDPIRAYEYLRLSSLAMHLLDRALIR